MKKALHFILAATICISAGYATADAKAKKKARPADEKVTFVTSMDCEHCATKIRENISFEKGVRDLKIDLDSKTVEITFDPARTDTTRLANAIRHLGYTAKSVSR